MSLQVLHYAAQMKLLTQKRIVRTGHAILTLPSDMADYAVEVIQEAHRMIVSMQEQVRTIRRRQRARRQQKTRQLTRMKRQTIAGTSTETEEEQNNENVDMEETHTPRASSSNDDMEQFSHIATAPAPAMPTEIKDIKKLETLTEQIRALKEQMELFAKAKQTDIASRSPPPAPALAVPSISAPPTPPPFIPDAPPCDIPIAPPLNDDIPMAPPMDDVTMQNPFTPFTPVRLMHNISETSSLTSPIPIESLSSPSTTSSSSSTPASISSSSNTSSPDKENITSSAPSSSQQRTPFRNVSNITSNHGTPGNTSVPIKLKPVTSEGGNGGAAVKLRPTPQAGLKRIFTRRIPGADVLTHNDLIKVSAKIKLRKTNVPRSPGGTPRKECSNQDPFANALFHKFKNVHGESSRRSIPSLVVPPAKRHSRASFGKREDEDEESWNTV